MTMGNRIAKRRKEKGYTQEYLAQVLGISRQAVGKWEQDLSAPDTKNLIALAELLDISVEELLTGKCSTGPTDTKLPVLLWRIGGWLFLGGFLLYIIGIITGILDKMFTIWAGNVGIGVPFLMYGTEPGALVILSFMFLLWIAGGILAVIASKLEKK